MQKTIVYIGNFVAPIYDAVAKRAIGLGLSLQKSGYKFKMIGVSDEVSKGMISLEEEFNNITYCNLHKCKNLAERFSYRNDIRLISQKIAEWQNTESIKGIIVGCTKCSLMANKILNICKKKEIPYIADCMDWLTSSSKSKIFDCIKNSDIWFELQYVNKKSDGLICISSFLSNYYNTYNKKTIIIPPLSPYKKESYNRINNSIPRIIYAGIPCRLDQPLRDPSVAKDRLDIILRVINKVVLSGHKVQLEIYGLTFRQFCVAFPEQKDEVKELIERGYVVFYGKVKEDIVRNAIKKADFTILLREQNRMTNAGFSTKISESIALGVPVITNDSSDILKYLKDGLDSVIIDINDLDGTVLKICNVLSNRYLMQSLHEGAINNQYFSPITYSDALNTFIRDI